MHRLAIALALLWSPTAVLAQSKASSSAPAKQPVPFRAISEFSGPGPYTLAFDSASDRFTGIDSRTVTTPILPTSHPSIGIMARIKDCRTSPPDVRVSADGECDQIVISFATVASGRDVPPAWKAVAQSSCLDLLITGADGRTLRRAPVGFCLDFEDSELTVPGGRVLTRNVRNAPDSLWLDLERATEVELRADSLEISLPPSTLEALRAFWVEADPRPETPPTILNRQVLEAALKKAYPRVLADIGQKGTVHIKCVVASDGSVDPLTIRVVYASHPDFAEPARQVASQARFSPGIHRGRPVRTSIVFPVNFQ